jgi:uncharacterized membrane protein HdeD (DUF308 family)
MSTMNSGQSVDEVEANALGDIGRNWWVLLFLGIISLGVGVIALVWPGATIVVVAILLAIWLLISGIFQVVRACALLIITGIISIILGLFMFRGAFQAVEILAIFIGIAFLFRGFGALFVGAEEKESRGWNIFGGIVMLIGGVVILVWPGISLVTLAWITGIWLIIIGIFEIVSAFSLKSAAKKAMK